MNVVDGYSHEPAIFFFISSRRSEPPVAFSTGTNDIYSWLVGRGKERRVSASFDKLHCSLLLLSRGC